MKIKCGCYVRIIIYCVIIIAYVLKFISEVSEIYDNIEPSVSTESWIQTIDDAYGVNIRQTDDLNYMLIGTLPDREGSSFWQNLMHLIFGTQLETFVESVMMNLDDMGEPIWGKTFGDIRFKYMEQINDNEYIISATIDDCCALLKVDGFGNIIWVKKSHLNSVPRSILPIENGFMVVGYVEIDSEKHAFVSKINEDGDEIWTKLYSSWKPYAEFYSIQQTIDGYMVLGYAYEGSSYTRSTDLIFTRLDSDGMPIWNKRIFLYANLPTQINMERINENEYILITKTVSQHRPMIMKFDLDGNVLWSKSISAGNTFCNIQQTSDGGFVIVGHHNPLLVVSYSLMVMKIDQFGNSEWT
jgi:hypothetical protein